ncbi:MAG: molybdate ABC transporter substrate-binding protein [bacterium]|nr:molybdate ABC transporter substrate-binding protein [bacterium]
MVHAAEQPLALRRPWPCRALTLLLAATSGCRDAASDELLVFAAASTHAPMRAIAAEFEAAHPGLRVRVHVAGTPTLAMQIREGAPADVFVAADERQMRRVTPDSRIVATNRLTIVTAANNPHGITGLADLARPDLLVALCAPEVPAGRYARQACERAGVSVSSVSDEPNVRALLAKVALGELDAGVLYETDVRGQAGVSGVAIAPGHNVIAHYPAAALSERSVARDFVAYLQTSEARSRFAGAGFLAP